MNISKLRSSISNLKSVAVKFTDNGKELLFANSVKSVIGRSNFELIGEELCINNSMGVGKCDLWLANCEHNFLLSLELKVGDRTDTKKQRNLKRQVVKYTDLMKFYFPEEIIYGTGAYKFIAGGVDFFDYQDCFKIIYPDKRVAKWDSQKITYYDAEINQLKLLISAL